MALCEGGALTEVNRQNAIQLLPSSSPPGDDFLTVVIAD
jgi:hypothetical protein